jgi:hypothetical protein
VWINFYKCPLYDVINTVIHFKFQEVREKEWTMKWECNRRVVAQDMLHKCMELSQWNHLRLLMYDIKYKVKTIFLFTILFFRKKEMRLTVAQGYSHSNELSKDKHCLELQHYVLSSHDLGHWSSTRRIRYSWNTSQWLQKTLFITSRETVLSFVGCSQKCC